MLYYTHLEAIFLFRCHHFAKVLSKIFKYFVLRLQSFMQGKSVVEMLKSLNNFFLSNPIVSDAPSLIATFFIFLPDVFLIGYPSHGCRAVFF